MSESITKYNHRMIAEESIQNFIKHLESESAEDIPDDHKEWLFEKGNEIFEAYYVDDQIQINLAGQEDKDKVQKYFLRVQEVLGRMFAHIMITEYNLFRLGG